MFFFYYYVRSYSHVVSKIDSGFVRLSLTSSHILIDEANVFFFFFFFFFSEYGLPTCYDELDQILQYLDMT
jgi:hypothetical protein